MKVRFKGVKIVQSCFRDESRENPGCVVFFVGRISLIVGFLVRWFIFIFSPENRF